VSEAGLFIGLISGTSRDGVDAVLLEFEHGHPAVRKALCLPYPEPVAEELERLARSGLRPGDDDLRRLDPEIAHHFANAVLRLLDEAGRKAGEIRAIGSHGQTVWHNPAGPQAESIQLGQPAAIARYTGITTVGDFRRADIEAGGQGAPLAPLLHRALFQPARGKRVVLNLGGIANISVIDGQGAVTGFDTGPANCLLDAWIRHHTGRSFDRDGAWAARGAVDSELLQRLMDDPWFVKPAPKSTGIEYFNLEWLRKHFSSRPLQARDIQATLAELTARSIANAIRPCQPIDVLLCGGGVHNSDLVARLQALLPGIPLRSTAEFGLDPDWIEAILFSWLAHERLAGRAQDTRAITGARQPVLLGTVAPPGGVE
jgi:anhydro-N-acetylmuramic acid kinase